MAVIGIMGGTFNPIHVGHIKIAQAAYEQYSLDEVWFMPNHIPAYKSTECIVSGDDRLHMVQLAIKDFPYFKASAFELNREGNTYTVETLALLKQQYPEHVFYFIMGADSLFSFDKWKKADDIPHYAKLLVAPRDEKSQKEIEEKIQKLNASYGDTCFQAIQCGEIPCSSSDIREEIKNRHVVDAIEQNKEQIISYLPDEVYAYIMKKGLYQSQPASLKRKCK